MLRRLRPILIALLVSVYVFSQLATLIMIPDKPAITDAVVRYGGQQWPIDVCYPVPYEQDRAGFTAAVYAVIPSVLHPYAPDCKDYLPR